MTRTLPTHSITKSFVLSPLIIGQLIALSLVYPNPMYATTTLSPSQLSQTIDTQLQTQLWQDLVNSGDEVETSADLSNSQTTEVNNSNSAEVTQLTDAVANTGYNQANRNISIGGNAGVIVTGDALVRTTGVVNANNTVTAVNQGDESGGVSSDSQLTNTGDELSSSTAVSSQKSTLIHGANNALINQVTNAQANTGHNVADRNISIGGVAGLIQTGQAGVETNYLVAANNTVALVGGSSDGSGGPGSGASIVLANSGHSSAYDINLINHKNTEISNTNTALINQGCTVCSVVTGGNESSRGIARGGDAGVIVTAPAIVALDFRGAVNANQTHLGTSTQNPYQQLALNALNTGDKTELSLAGQSTQTIAASQHNVADVTQSVNANADTGHNEADRNISIGGDAGVIYTGDAIIDILMSVVANPSQFQ